MLPRASQTSPANLPAPHPQERRWPGDLLTAVCSPGGSAGPLGDCRMLSGCPGLIRLQFKNSSCLIVLEA